MLVLTDSRSKWTQCSRAQRRSAVCLLVTHQLDGVLYPYWWVALADGMLGLCQGVLIGAASTSGAPCSTVRTCMWMLFGVCIANALLAVGLRPRSTYADCGFQFLMTVWSAVATLVAAIGIEDSSSDISVLLQIAVQLTWSVSWIAWRCRVVLLKFKHRLLKKAIGICKQKGATSTAWGPTTAKPSRSIARWRGANRHHAAQHHRAHLQH